MKPSTRNTATGSLKPASPSSVSASRRRSEDPCSSANTAAPSVEARIEPSSSPSSVDRSNSTAAARPVTTAVTAVPTTASPSDGRSTGAAPASPVARPPSKRIAASARTPMSARGVVVVEVDAADAVAADRHPEHEQQDERGQADAPASSEATTPARAGRREQDQARLAHGAVPCPRRGGSGVRGARCQRPAVRRAPYQYDAASAASAPGTAHSASPTPGGFPVGTPGTGGGTGHERADPGGQERADDPAVEAVGNEHGEVPERETDHGPDKDRHPFQVGSRPPRAVWGEDTIRRSETDEAAADRVARELDAVAHAELLEDVRAVALDRLLADEQHLGDLLVGVRLGDELDDLLLARGERVVGRRLAGAGALDVARASARAPRRGRGTARRASSARQASTRSRSTAVLST